LTCRGVTEHWFVAQNDYRIDGHTQGDSISGKILRVEYFRVAHPESKEATIDPNPPKG
jgi:hypothetical protein